MKKILNVTLLGLTLFFLPLQFAIGGESVAIIVNASNTQQLTAQQVKNIYADIVTQWDNGNNIAVLNLRVDKNAREVFSQKIFGESAQKLAQAESNRKITNTIRNPSKTKTARLVLKIVSTNPNAIGYIPLSMIKEASKVRILLQID